jgi:hypothetical protein
VGNGRAAAEELADAATTSSSIVRTAAGENHVARPLLFFLSLVTTMSMTIIVVAISLSAAAVFASARAG